MQRMEVVYDTGSDWLVIEADDCVNCYGNTYEWENSEDFRKKH